jgi:hypothetical protein
MTKHGLGGTIYITWALFSWPRHQSVLLDDGSRWSNKRLMACMLHMQGRLNAAGLREWCIYCSSECVSRVHFDGPATVDDNSQLGGGCCRLSERM